jgi:hypothetical protein
VVDSNADIQKSISSLRAEVEEFAAKFPLPGRQDI